MEQTNFDSSNGTNPDRRIDSSRRRAEAEAANQRAQEEEWRARDAEEVSIPPVEQASTEHEQASTDQMWQRWREIQSTFVDDPRNAVSEAHAMVSGVIDRVVQQLQEQRSQLERGWSNADSTSTEDLRRGLQGYREFLQRLLSRDEIPKA
jgi:hypothetical protein